MFLKSSLPLAPVSGFVAFDGGGAMPLPAPVRSPVVARAPLVVEPTAPTVEIGMPQSATWQPASAGRVRKVEGAVLIAVCGWFAFGVGRVFGWI